MLRNRALPLLLAMCSIVLHCGVGHAQSSSASVTEDFTGTTTNNQWYFFGDACLTAGKTSVTGNLGQAAGTDASGNSIYTFEGCVANTNYTEKLVGGYNGSKSGSVAIGSTTALDPAGYGALRFTNGCINSSTNSCSSGSGGGHNQNGAIISANTFSTSQGLDITFKTVTYRGDSLGGGSDGADGMSFFLMDGDTDLTDDPTENIGSYGGSLGYTCSNQNNNETEPYHGMVGAYLGLGIDEYGNFLNGSSNNLNETDGSWNDPAHWEDNTASGGLYKPNRIGLRGRGNIAWNWLTTHYPVDYPTGLSASAQNQAVQYTCRTGYLWDYSQVLIGGSATETTTQVDDYLAIPDAYKIFSKKIANEYSSGGYSRRPPGSTTASGDTGATPITYRLKITQDGILSLAYSYDGGAWSNVIQNRQISDSNGGSVPSTVRFGFAGSTGGSSNIHEILCFKATPVTQAASSTTVNQQQSSKVESGSQAYFGYYDPTDWTGRLTANSLMTDSSGNLTIASAANWDASCVLTGVTSCPTTGASGPTTAQSYKNSVAGGRVILTWSGSAGIPLEYSALSSSEQSAITAGDSSPAAYRVDYLRGDRENEIPSTGASGTKIYRDRDSVLGDIVDSSSAWVGPPSKSIFSAYESPFTWRDRLYPTATMSENTHSYDSFAQAKSQRLNVVYVGSNDGMVHGFSAGSYDSSGTTYDSSTNTGAEVLAYMPQGVLQTIHNSSDSQLDFSNTQYGHNFFVDATPSTGDLYYGNAWHTWLVGGLGPGGAEIYALDITDPSTFSEGTTSAAATVIGDWLASSITCTNPTDGTTNSCKDSSGNSYLGNTYGTPQIRRLHNGDWAVLFGNGIGSPSGDAGLFILTIDASGTQTLYYLSTGVSGSNGIAYVTPVDMDGDHVVDYVYAGDLLGNVWRFDLTSNSAASWAVTPGPVFKTPSGQPITTAIQPDFVTGPIGSTTQLMLFFGSGEKFPLTNSSPVSYQTGTQSFYGVWDWNMTAWNAHSSSQFAKVAATTVGTLTSLGSPYTLGTANLRSQTISIDSSTGDRLVQSTNPVCWAGTSTCSGGSSANAKFGWYISLPGTNTAFSATTYEQVTFNPSIVSTAVVFNSILPAVDSPLMCTPDKDKGWTYALDVRSGGAIPNFFINPGTTTTTTNNLATQTVAYEADASGTSSEVDTSNGSGGTNYYLIFQSNNGGAGTPLQIQPGANVSSSRQTWIQIR